MTSWSGKSLVLKERVERERDRQTDRQTDRERQRDIDRQGVIMGAKLHI